MFYQLAADVVLVVHLAFVTMVVLGGLLALRFPRAPLLHVPVALWGAYVEIWGAACPLTTLENYLLNRAGAAGYPGSFVGRYLLAALYPEGLTREVQLALGALVVLINVIIYGWLWWRRRSRGR